MRVSDTRGYYGERFAYRLTVRKSRPDFKVTLKETSPTISPGSGQQFSLTVDRIDGFDNDIVIDFQNVPAGFKVSSPITIQAGHLEAAGQSMPRPMQRAEAETLAKITVTARSKVGGKR